MSLSRKCFKICCVIFWNVKNHKDENLLLILNNTQCIRFFWWFWVVLVDAKQFPRNVNNGYRSCMVFCIWFGFGAKTVVLTHFLFISEKSCTSDHNPEEVPLTPKSDESEWCFVSYKERVGLDLSQWFYTCPIKWKLTEDRVLTSQNNWWRLNEKELNKVFKLCCPNPLASERAEQLLHLSPQMMRVTKRSAWRWKMKMSSLLWMMKMLTIPMNPWRWWSTPASRAKVHEHEQQRLDHDLLWKVAHVCRHAHCACQPEVLNSICLW